MPARHRPDNLLTKLIECRVLNTDQFGATNRAVFGGHKHCLRMCANETLSAISVWFRVRPKRLDKARKTALYLLCCLGNKQYAVLRVPILADRDTTYHRETKCCNAALIV